MSIELESDRPTVFERELTTFRPVSGEIESVKVIQMDDGSWLLRLGLSWKSGLECDVQHYDKRKPKLYSSISSAVRHVCDVYDYSGRIILFPKKGQPIK
jgi:hypothetical protein